MTSQVWAFFRREKGGIEICNRCSKPYKTTNSSTSPLLRHIKESHISDYLKITGSKPQNPFSNTIKKHLKPTYNVQGKLRKEICYFTSVDNFSFNGIVKSSILRKWPK